MSGSEALSRKFRKELNAGVVSLLLLSSLDGSEEPLYGYRIAKQLERVNRGPLPMKPGALYPVLRSLETLGLLSSKVEPSVTGPPRRYYRITGEGRAVLREWRAIWAGTRTLVDAVIEGVKGANDGKRG